LNNPVPLNSKVHCEVEFDGLRMRSAVLTSTTTISIRIGTTVSALTANAFRVEVLPPPA